MDKQVSASFGTQKYQLATRPVLEDLRSTVSVQRLHAYPSILESFGHALIAAHLLHGGPCDARDCAVIFTAELVGTYHRSWVSEWKVPPKFEDYLTQMVRRTYTQDYRLIDALVGEFVRQKIDGLGDWNRMHLYASLISNTVEPILWGEMVYWGGATGFHGSTSMGGALALFVVYPVNRMFYCRRVLTRTSGEVDPKLSLIASGLKAWATHHPHKVDVVKSRFMNALEDHSTTIYRHGQAAPDQHRRGGCGAQDFADLMGWDIREGG
jgi:hypothetical protein